VQITFSRLCDAPKIILDNMKVKKALTARWPFSVHLLSLLIRALSPRPASSGAGRTAGLFASRRPDRLEAASTRRQCHRTDISADLCRVRIPLRGLR
jgi:hypothetical protein